MSKSGLYRHCCLVSMACFHSNRRGCIWCHPRLLTIISAGHPWIYDILLNCLIGMVFDLRSKPKSYFEKMCRSLCHCRQRRRRTEKTQGMKSPNCSSATWNVSSSVSISSERSFQTSSLTKWTLNSWRISRSGERDLTYAVQHLPSWSTALTLFSHRLQYFARGLQVYIRQLRVALQGKTGDALKTDEVTSQHCCRWLHGWLYLKCSFLLGVEQD